MYKLVYLQYVCNKKKCIGSTKERLVHLIFVNNKILTQYCLRHSRFDSFEQFDVAAKIWLVGQDRNHIRRAFCVEVGNIKRRLRNEHTLPRGFGFYLGGKDTPAIKELSE